MSREDFSKALAFAARSKLSSIQLLGGEPSLHPELPTLVEMAWAAGFEVTIFTNGLWPPPHLARMKQMAAEQEGRLALILNLNEREFTPEKEEEQQLRLLDDMGGFVTLSYNIFRVDFDPTFLIDRIESFHTRRFIRLGIAQPLAAAESRFVPVTHYGDLASKIADFVTSCDQRDIQVGFDCGFLLCMFDAEQIGRMVVAGAQFKTGCGPAVDVGTDLSVWACFPLSTLTQGEHLTEFDDVHAVARHFHRRFERLYRTGMLPGCRECRHLRRGQCSGGCAAHVYRSFNP